MANTSRSRNAILAAIAAALFLGACGDDEPDNTPTPEPIALSHEAAPGASTNLSIRAAGALKRRERSRLAGNM